MKHLLTFLLSSALIFSMSAQALSKTSVAHPLDPLNGEEITTAVKIIQSSEKFNKGTLFPQISLQEPPKSEVLAHKPGKPYRREAFAVLLDRSLNKTYEVVVDLHAKKVVSWKHIPNVQPSFLVEELTSAPEIVKKDPRWIEAMAKRGITDMNDLQIDGWAPGTLGVTSAEGPRLVRILAFYKGKSSNIYARPVEGVVAVVDMNARKVIDFEDTGVIPISKDDGAYDEKSLGKLREAPRPLRISQPKGQSFQVNGNEVRWQKWRFRFSMHPREGLVIQTVSYDDGGESRSVMYRGSLSEMVVPYGDPDKLWAWRSAFDVGEYGVGRLASPLEPKIDAPENATLFDADFVDDFGKAYKLPRSVMLYERDGGLLWKHYDINSGKNESRRARQLVIGFIATVGNYDYSILWIFHQDGTLEVQAQLTGIMLAKGIMPLPKGEGHAKAHEELMKHGHQVSETVIAPHHQHFFNFRLDMDVDGTDNSLLELNTRAVDAGSENPYLNALVMEPTVLKKEKDARRDLDLGKQRKWLVVNNAKQNRLGHPVGFALMPGETSNPYIQPKSLIRKRAGFVNHHFWATVCKADELSAAGAYPNQTVGGDGLEKFVDDNESLQEKDLVLWYNMAVTHIPRPEEWPIMSVHTVGFKLMPVSFFARNPALDVPKASSK